MANWTTLKEAIANVIKTNGNQEITGQVLQNTLTNIVNAVGENATFVGVATPSTNPGTPDGPVFYLATNPGVYSNFGGIKVASNEAAIIKWNSGSWNKISTGFSTEANASELALSKDFIRVGESTSIQRNLTAAIRNIRIILDKKQEEKPIIAIALFRKNYPDGKGEIRFKLKLNGIWEYCFQSDKIDIVEGKVSHVDKVYNYTGVSKPFSKIRVIFDVDFDFAQGQAISSFVYGDDLSSEPTYIISSERFFYNDINETNVSELEANVSELKANVSELEANMSELETDNSFIRVGEATPQQIFYNGIVKNVSISITDESTLEKIDISSIALLLIRKNTKNVELWWSAKSLTDDSRVTILRDNITSIEDINTEGYTHFEFSNSNLGITIAYDVDYNKVSTGVSKFIYDSAKGNPTFVVSQSHIINSNNNKFRENIAAGQVYSFIPYKFGMSMQNVPSGVFDIKTPYLITESTILSVFLEIGDAGSSGARIGGLSIRLNFWLFRNGFSYYPPKAIYGLPVNTPEIPIRLASDVDGYVHIILGKDNTAWAALGHANNLFINIDKVYAGGKSYIRQNNWSITNTNAIDETYETVTDVQSLIAPAEKNEFQADVLPVKPASFAIFGSSKSTTRQLSRDTGWVGKLLHGLFKKAGLVIDFTAKTLAVSGLNTGRRFFSNASKKITGVNNFIEFETYGNALSIVQVIARTTDYGVFNVYADNSLIGVFDNKNKTLKGSKTVAFEGDGIQRSFFIPDLCSFNFNVQVNSIKKTVTMDPSTIASGSYECYAVRTILPNGNGQVQRILYFSSAPTGTINVTYEIGDLIAYSISDYHTKENGLDENTNPVYISDVNSAATYASGYPLMPMLCDERAVVRFNFGTYAKRKIKIQIVNGVNPYFDFDFAVAEYNTLMNAAFGGYDVLRVISEGRWRDWRCLRYFFNPDKLFMEYGTNDDRYQIDRILVSTKEMTLDELKKTKMKLVKTITKSGSNLSVGLCIGTIQSITAFTITSEDIKTSDIEVGDYLRIGEYHSSWREFVVRRVTAVDKGAGTVTWDVPFNPDTIWHYNTLDDMVGAQFAVRRLGQFKTNMQTAITKMKSVLPSTKIYLVGMSAFRDNDYCSGWGYDECLQDLAKEFSCEYINISNEQIRFNEGALSDSNEIEITSTGASTYTVKADSFSNQNREMRVLVNGVDITGVSAYIDVKNGWYVKGDATIDDVELTASDDWNDVTPFALDNAKGDVDIVFYKDIPTTSDQIKLICAKVGWSDDGVHQTTNGNITYSDSIIKVF